PAATSSASTANFRRAGRAPALFISPSDVRLRPRDGADDADAEQRQRANGDPNRRHVQFVGGDGQRGDQDDPAERGEIEPVHGSTSAHVLSNEGARCSNGARGLARRIRKRPSVAAGPSIDSRWYRSSYPLKTMMNAMTRA